MPQTPIPPDGFQVILGNTDMAEPPVMAYCLRPGDELLTRLPDELDKPKYKTIATQCCGDDGTTCYRSYDPATKTAGDSTHCIAGMGGDEVDPAYEPLKPMTHGEAVATCESLGLGLCRVSCYAHGCSYNGHGIHTSLSCDRRLPDQGLQVISGGTKPDEPTELVHCLRSGDELLTSVPASAAVEERRIATQCCSLDGFECYRRFNASTGSSDGECIAGRDEGLALLNFFEAEALCASLGLGLCDGSCYNEGCGYNSHPVYTKLPCAPPTPTPPASPAGPCASVLVSSSLSLTAGLYYEEGTKNGRPKFKSASGAVLKFELLSSGDWGATNFMEADGWTIKADGKHQYGLPMDVPISEVHLFADHWMVRLNATLPISVGCVVPAAR